MAKFKNYVYREVFLEKTRRKCSMSKYRVFNVYADKDKKKLLMCDCDVVSFSEISHYGVGIDIVNNMIRIFTCDDDIVINTTICTLQVRKIYEGEIVK